MSFDERLKMIRAGDAGALNELLNYWRPFLRLQARELLGRRFTARADSSDVVQETLSHVSRDVMQFRGSSEAQWFAWLRAILFTQAAKLRRHHLAERRHVEREVEAVTDAADRGPDPLSHMLDHEHMGSLSHAIEALPEIMREVVIRRVFEQQPFDEVAQAIQRSNGATRVLWTRAVRQIRAKLERSELPEEEASRE